MRQKLSVIIPTKNEQLAIARALQSVRWADEILVVDSQSDDRTVEIAQSLGARVLVQPWLGWIGQKAFAIENTKYDWVLWIDADEIITDELAHSIQMALEENPSPADGYVFERPEEFLGVLMPNMRRPSKRKSFVRLFNKTQSSWNPKLLIHEEIRCPGRLIPLEGKMLHWRNYTIFDQMTTLNKNTDIESTLIPPNKLFFLLLLMKPIARFVWLYFICGNWRYGIRGYVWSCLHSFAEFLRHAKAWEQNYTHKMPDPPPSLISKKDPSP